LVVVALVAKKLAIVPSDVREEFTTFEARVVPVSADAATEPAEPVMEPVIGLMTERSVKTELAAKRFVVVAAVVVDLETMISERPRSAVRFGRDVVAFSRASKRPPKVVV
jgi:hypothetical protein